MTILVDMDDVLEQLVAGWLEYINERYGTHTVPADVVEWDLSKAFPTLTHEQVYGVELEDEVWDRVKPMPGADEALRKMIADGHEIYVVTATEYETLRAKMEKVLFRYFPYIDWRHVIITHNKPMIRGDILIDDGPHNFAGGEYHKILFDAYHNRSFDEKAAGVVRVHGWEEVYEEVCRYAESKKQ